MVSRFELFSIAISNIYRSIQKIEREEMDRYGLKGVYAQYLVALARYPEGLTAAKLSEVCDLDKAAVSRAVSEMAERGLLERRAVNETSYRAKLCLTDAGKRAAEYVSTRAQRAVDAAGTDMTEEERKIMYAGLVSVANKLQTISRNGLPVE